MTLHKSINAGEIWLAYLHFIDKPEVGKVRPVLVLSVDEGLTVVALKIASNTDLANNCAVAIENWEQCGLRKPSVVRVDQSFYIPESDLLNEAPLGIVDSALMQAIEDRAGATASFVGKEGHPPWEKDESATG